MSKHQYASQSSNVNQSAPEPPGEPGGNGLTLNENLYRLDTLRIEALKLAHVHGDSHQTITGRAQAYFEWLKEEPA